MRAILLGLLASGVVATLAVAQSRGPRTFPSPPSAEPRLRGMPRMGQAPQSSGAGAPVTKYPLESYDRSISGDVVVTCGLAGRRLEFCNVVSESPEGLGFGNIAANLIRKQWRYGSRRFVGAVAGDRITFNYTVAAPEVATRGYTVAPSLARAPTGDEIASVWPEHLGMRRGVGVLRCAVDSDGALNDCRVAGETPAQSGLGDAALSLSPRFRIDMSKTGGELAGTDVIISVRLANPAPDTAGQHRVDNGLDAIRRGTP